MLGIVTTAITPAEISVRLLTVSDRSFAGEREDRSGPAAFEALVKAGFSTAEPRVIPDGRESVETELESAIAAGADVILTLGGTGVGPRDLTPEGTARLLELPLPGIAEGLRAAGTATVPTAILSRGVSGISRPTDRGHRAVIVNLPGSPGGSRDGVDFLVPILPHLVDQMRGGDH